MGGLLLSKTAAWTLFFWFVLCSVKTVLAATDLDFLQDLGLESNLDVTKINVSQDEYTRMMNVYLERLTDSQQSDTIPKLITFNSERKSWRRRRDDVTRLRFPVKPSTEDVEIENAELRLLTPPIPNKSSIRVKVYQVLSPRRRRFLEERVVYPSQLGPKWCEFDVTEAVQRWMLGDRNLGLELECIECGELRPIEAALSALVLPGGSRRRRSAHYDEGRRTDCISNESRPRCCRHDMEVSFKKLKMDNILAPKSYEAGFCRGRCPLNYNHATNHSRIQNMVHKLDRKATPRACCAPSKLEPLEILRVDPHDGTKLSVDKWDNMKVLECACS
ncbi:PREDICTED: bone morphogenetic protein 5 [Nicrophorus vespilloides]|uniref:Bone morphogenetic protein 5 n=1 Tax=Nicrophorus vespilloides TaxID=110193 RepID=A0ABM1NH37_NICVS|nr:PREDICTED: bone morphogenetic protein 5 [Nicrophorus vespilloides]